MKIRVFRCSCRACNQMFVGSTQDEANKKHKEHIQTCETIKALEKVERFWKQAESILGRKLSRKEVYKMLGIKL